MPIIQIIDDSALFRRMVTRILTQGGVSHEIRSYESGQAAVDNLSTDQPVFIVCDVHMPDNDGPASLRMIARTCERIGIPLPTMVLMSSRPDATTIAGATESGAVDFWPSQHRQRWLMNSGKNY